VGDQLVSSGEQPGVEANDMNSRLRIEWGEGQVEHRGLAGTPTASYCQHKPFISWRSFDFLAN
jgi:hypothetical protein